MINTYNCLNKSVATIIFIVFNYLIVSCSYPEFNTIDKVRIPIRF